MTLKIGSDDLGNGYLKVGNEIIADVTSTGIAAAAGKTITANAVVPASQAEAEAGTDNTKPMTALRVAQALVPAKNIVVKQIVDTTDITLNDIATSYNNFGSSFSLTIPTSGQIRAAISARLRSDTTSTSLLYFGLRIGTTNYWFGRYDNNGAIADRNTMQSGAALNSYLESSGDSAAGATGSIEMGINISAVGLPTGNQTVQLIVARSVNACSLRGTTTPSRIVLTVKEAS